MLPQYQIDGPDVLAISSLAKGFGAPVAVLSGSRAAVEEFKANSETRVHCSPPSVAVIRAAEHALRVSYKQGDRLRLRLASLVMRFRRGAQAGGLEFTGGLFPVQTLAPASKAETVRLYERLLHKGVRTVLRGARHGQDPRLSFVITARHTPEAIDRAVSALTQIEG
jgi:8-amino-7-oxononanoate synthase